MEERIHDKLTELYEKYVGDEYVLNRLDNYICNILPAGLEKAKLDNEKRTKRREQLSADADSFTERFLNKGNYFYCFRNELYLHYNGEHFVAYSEDDIQHQILTSITHSKNLVPWKHKIKINIMKRLRDRCPLDAIPESKTIQNILNNLYPNFFVSKNSAKHFLASVGDSIRGDKNNTYIVPSELKDLIREIETVYYTHFGSASILSNFKLKYYAHDYAKCRFLQCIPSNNITSVDNRLSKYIIDLLCVAKHYSERYQSSDNYLNHSKDSFLKDYVLFLSNKTPETLVDTFIQDALYSCSGAKIKSKNMIFVWKKWLDERNMPNIIFYDTLTTMFKGKMQYDNENDIYLDITSSHLPVVSSFVNFWDNCMKEDIGAPELEIDEIITLFSKSSFFKSSFHCSEEFILELIHYMYPEVVTEECKYVLNIRCSEWDKKTDIDLFLEQCKSNNNMQFTYLTDCYELYTNRKENLITMSKRCFEKIARDIMESFIDEDGEINTDFWTNTV